MGTGCYWLRSEKDPRWNFSETVAIPFAFSDIHEKKIEELKNLYGDLSIGYMKH